MEPRIDETQFGSVTIDGRVFEHDVLIRLGGKVEKRNKKLSKAVYGTSHTISLAEARHVHQKGVGAAAHRCRAARQGQAVGGGGCPLQAPSLPGGAAADTRDDPGLESGRGRGDRPGPRNLVRGSLAGRNGIPLSHRRRLVAGAIPIVLRGLSSTADPMGTEGLARTGRDG